MTVTHRCRIDVAFVLVVGLVGLVPMLAHGHGEPGEEIEAFAEHLDDYRAQVEELTATVDGIADDYAAGRTESARTAMDDFVERWEAIEYHSVVEVKAAPLYGPIWAGIQGLRGALDGENSPDEVRQASRALVAALWEGMGAIRLAAATEGDPGEQ